MFFVALAHGGITSVTRAFSCWATVDESNSVCPVWSWESEVVSLFWFQSPAQPARRCVASSRLPFHGCVGGVASSRGWSHKFCFILQLKIPAFILHCLSYFASIPASLRRLLFVVIRIGAAYLAGTATACNKCG